MELEQAQKRVEELRAVIEKNNRLYYDQDAPELEDFEYDALTRELKELEAQFPQLVTPNSPTQHVGGTPSGRFAKVTHAVKMESLLDAFSFDELRDFDRRSSLIIAFSSPNIAAAKALQSSVLPTPVGPKKMNEPMGFFGSLSPTLPRRIALETASTASS